MTTHVFLNVNFFSETMTHIVIKTFETLLTSSISKLVEAFYKGNKIQNHIVVEVVIAFSTIMSLLFRELLETPLIPRLIRKRISRFSIKYSQIVEAD